ncbi:MAG: EF-hand domain-containing protein [Pseudomonadota bacterium]
MKRTLIVLALAGSSFALPAAAGPLEDAFFQMDRSKDGQLSREEFVTFQQSEGLTERQANFAFDNLRGDDARVTLNEFRTGPQPRARRTPQTSAARRPSPPPRRTTRSAPRGGGFGS